MWNMIDVTATGTLYHGNPSYHDCTRCGRIKEKIKAGTDSSTDIRERRRLKPDYRENDGNA